MSALCKQNRHRCGMCLHAPYVGDMQRFKAVILAGGSGERFWPLSTPERPKQFLSIFGGESLIRQTVTRLRGLVSLEDINLITAKALVLRTRKELSEIPKANIVGEPERRDTAAAVALGVEVAGDGIIGFFPADQMIGKQKASQTSLKKAIEIAEKVLRIVTLGIKPSYPATGFGYINPRSGKFVEKPNVETAAEYVKAGYLWNAGIFIASSATFKARFCAHAPHLLGLKATAKSYEKLPKISFDFAIMEHQDKVEIVPVDCAWDDVGSYAAFEKYFKPDPNGNICLGATRVVNSSDSIVIGNATPISLLGVSGLVIVSTKNGILVMPKSEISSIKKLFQR